jgi:hypothetical protein
MKPIESMVFFPTAAPTCEVAVGPLLLLGGGPILTPAMCWNQFNKQAATIAFFLVNGASIQVGRHTMLSELLIL